MQYIGKVYGLGYAVVCAGGYDFEREGQEDRESDI